MAPSQLKQLKASLREGGVLGPQKSKKQRKESSKDAQKRQQRNAALEGIRERFNPFEVKAPARKEKYEISTNRPVKKAIERPGVTRGLGEERRRATLLKEMQARHKVGGMTDRRFGEDDPNMTPEQKAAERFASQAMKVSRKNAMFNLEDDSGDEIELTHGGRSLQLDGKSVVDDFDEILSGSEDQDLDTMEGRALKRIRLDTGDDDESENPEVPDRKKTKKEVMEEVIAKSKAYKAQRQAAKEDDDELRRELDKDMSAFYAAIQSQRSTASQLPSPPVTDSEPTLNPIRAAMLAGKSRVEADREYEAMVRELKLEARSKPEVRTKTEEEKAIEDKERLEEQERKRLQRMQGEADSADEAEVEADVPADGDDEERDDADEFGLGQARTPYIPNLDVEEEDEFVMDDIVASGSEVNTDDSDDESSNSAQAVEDDGDDEFVNGLVLPQNGTTSSISSTSTPQNSLAFTYPCPQDADEFMRVMHNVPDSDIPTAVQRIRALYHKSVAEGNKEKLGRFAIALCQGTGLLADRQETCEIAVLEQLLRHIHSMAKDQPDEVALGMRDHLRKVADRDDASLTFGDLVLLTGVSTIYPTSDKHHGIVTPAMLVLTRFLAQQQANSLLSLYAGAFACTLILRYQSRSERYVPEVINHIQAALVHVCTYLKQTTLSGPIAKAVSKLEVSKPSLATLRALYAAADFSDAQQNNYYYQILGTYIGLTSSCTNLWQRKSAYPELIQPILTTLNEISALNSLPTVLVRAVSRSTSHIIDTVKSSVRDRRPLLLHSHRPLAIKTSLPAFSETYNPERKHHDPDQERAEMNRLKAEHKKEKKGAMRELRKDANFMAREQLREKKERDEAYEKKYRRLVAEIQGEEGREAKEYEKERKKRRAK